MVVQFMRIIQSGFTAAGAIALLSVRPKVQLARDEVIVPVAPGDFLAEFTRRFANTHDDILAMEEHRLVRRFAGNEGPFAFAPWNS
jgi:hypothetical protein